MAPSVAVAPSLINMMLADCRNSVERHLRDSLAKINDYDELEWDLHAELYPGECPILTRQAA